VTLKSTFVVQDYFCFSEFLEFLYEFWDQFVSFCKKAIWDFGMDYSESYVTLGSIIIDFAILILTLLTNGVFVVFRE
jgi:hypothetical protein